MAPEQLLGRPTDFRADQFAFGVLLYELCTGRHPVRRSVAAVDDRAESSPASRSRRRATDEIPDGVWRIIERCLQKDPWATIRVDARRWCRRSRRCATHRASTSRTSRAGSTGTHQRTGTVAPSHPGHRSQLRPAAHAAAGALWWWRFHQLAAALVYWAMVWPVWHVHRDLGRGGLFFFFATLAAVVVAGQPAPASLVLVARLSRGSRRTARRRSAAGFAAPTARSWRFC